MQEALPDLDLENAIIVVNGRIEKKHYTLKENDIVTVRLTPGATGAIIALAVTAAVVAIGAGVVGGIAMYKAHEAAEKAEK